MATKQQTTTTTTAPDKGKAAATTTNTALAATPAAAAMSVVEELGADIFADAGKGLTNIDADSVAIPFLAVLQTNSPQVDPDDGAYVPGAKAGMFYNTVTKEAFDGKEGLFLVPCEYQRKFLRWQARETGGGFKGEIGINQVVAMRERGELIEMDNRLYVPSEDGSVNPKKSDKVSDTRVHYVLLLNPHTGAAQQAVVSLGSTQIKKSKNLLALLGGVTIEHPETHQKATPPTFAIVVHITTVPESNDQGKWHGVQFSVHGFVKDPNTYRMARGFHKLINAGRAQVNFEQQPGAEDAREEARRF